MRMLSALLIVALSATFASAAPIQGSVVLRDVGLTTNALIYPGAFDVYEVVMDNPNGAATAVELTMTGDFIDAGATTFKVGSELPVVFGFDAPDAFFVLPAGADANDVLGVDTQDDTTILTSSYVVSGGVEILAAGNSVLAVISVPTGADAPNPISWFGRAAVNGQFETIQFIPEPSTAILALLGLAGVAARRRS